MDFKRDSNSLSNRWIVQDDAGEVVGAFVAPAVVTTPAEAAAMWAAVQTDLAKPSQPDTRAITRHAVIEALTDMALGEENKTLAQVMQEVRGRLRG